MFDIDFAKAILGKRLIKVKVCRWPRRQCVPPSRCQFIHTVQLQFKIKLVLVNLYIHAYRK